MYIIVFVWHMCVCVCVCNVYVLYIFFIIQFLCEYMKDMDTLLTKKKMIASSYTWYTMMTILSLLMLYNANLFFKGQAEQGSNIIL